MAKMFGLGGVLTGKLGNTVLAVVNGIQVARQYQPIVQNPKSNAQQLQRAKANLAGRLSALVPREAISGLGNNARARRARFLQIVLNNATSSFVNGVAEAKIQPASLKFSEGAGIAIAHNYGVSLSGNVLTVTYNRYSAVSENMWNNSGMRYVLLGVDPVTGVYDTIYTGIVPMGDYPAGAGTEKSFTIDVDATSRQFYLYIVSWQFDTAKLATLTSALGGDAANIIANLSTKESEYVAVYASSQYANVTIAG